MNDSMVSKASRLGLFALGLMVLIVAGCTPEGVINKTKYDGQKITNTCESFSDEVAGLVEANTGASVLRVAEYDNSSFSDMFIEPGQFLQHGDTLYFRLINDLEYDKYLHKGVAIHVNASYQAQQELMNVESDPQGVFGALKVDRAYYEANKQPYFIYKMPVEGKLDGKQLLLTFSVAKYKKSGSLKKYFCESDTLPIGLVDAPCCTDKPWQDVNPRSIVQTPELDIEDEKYRYKGFTGTLDLIFPMMSTDYNEQELNDVILNYITKYEKVGFELQGIRIEGYASQGGTIELNTDLSQRRSQAVYDHLVEHFKKVERLEDLNLDYQGKGEDWERFELLVKTAVFSDDERNRLLEIASSNVDVDEKEAMLRKVPFWEKLVNEVLIYCRHTFITFDFDFVADKMYVEDYNTKMPMISPELYNVATKRHIISAYEKGADANEGLGVLNTLIDVNGNKKANLYAMRSTYHFALENVKSAISDIENAMNLEEDNLNYGLAALSYKTQYASSYTMSERVRMLNDYNSFIIKYPENKNLAYNRAVMMEKVGYLSGALAEYEKLMTGNERDAVLLNNQGVARLKASRLVEAEASFKKATQVDKNMAEAYLNLAIIYAYRGFTDKCLEALDQAVAIDSNMKCKIFSNPVFKVLKKDPKFAKYKC